MARKVRRANRRKISSWSKGNTIERRSTIGLGFLNTNGWNATKKDDIERAMAEKNLDVFSIAETKKMVGEKKIKIEGCRVFETRRETMSGGLACAVRESVGVSFSQHSPTISNPDLAYVDYERLWVKYSSDKGKSAICTTYLGFQAADNRHYEWNVGIYKVLAEEIRNLRGDGYRVILMGDFNGWIGNIPEDGGIPGNRAKVTPNGELLLAFIRDNSISNLNSAVRTPGDWDTRICQGLWTRHSSDYASSSILDYVLVTEEHLGGAIEMIVDQDGAFGGSSDHNMVFSRWADKFISVPRTQPPRKPTWNIEEANWDKFREVVHKEISEQIVGSNSVDSLSDALSRALTKGLNVAAAKKPLAKPQKILYPKNIVILLKERRQLEKQFKSEKSAFANSWNQPPPHSLIVAKEQLDDKAKELKEAIARFERKMRAPLLNLVKGKSRRDRRKFWEFVNRKSKKSSGMPPLQDKRTGVLKHKPEEIADEVFLYLKEIFSGTDEPPIDPQPGQKRRELSGHEQDESDDTGPIPGVPGEKRRELSGQEENPSRDHEYSEQYRSKLPQGGTSGLSDSDPSGFLNKDFTVTEVNLILKGLGNGKAAGHDELVNEALKEAPISFTRLLTKMFNLVKATGKVPKAWNRGRIVLIHKKGPVADVSNYRPLTILPCMYSAYSKVLNARLTEVVEKHHLLGEVQNGFRRDRSGIDSAFILNSVLWKTSAQQKKVNLAFLDLQKAYDSIQRDTLWKILADKGFGGAFLESLKSLYKGDYVVSDVNGIPTKPCYLGRGLRQGCSLSPLLFALYVADMSMELHLSNLGVKMHRVCISCLFFADDIVLIARDADGLRALRDIVQRHCRELGMKISVSKSKVLSSVQDVWELFENDVVAGTFEKVLMFKYLGVETKLSPAKSARAMMKRATTLASSYSKTCMSLAFDGPDIVDLAMCLWGNVGLPSILYGCEIITFSKSAIDEIERQQSAVGKFNLGLPLNAPNISASSILGIKPFREQLYTAQLKYLLRLFNQDSRRWSKDAFLDHLNGTWNSKYIKYMTDLRDEVGLKRWPRSIKEIKLSLEAHFLKRTNDEIDRLDLPALEPLAKRARMEFVNETKESQVDTPCMFLADSHIQVYQLC